MVRAVLLAALMGVASAFIAPVPTRRATLKMGASDMVGYDVETGGKPFDPWGFSTLSEVYPKMLGMPAHAKWLRESELKHGRTAMLAFVGVLVPTLGINVPGYPVEPDWTQALQKAAVQNPLGVAQILLAIGIIEGHFYPGEFWAGEGDRNAGEFGFDPLGFSKGKSDAAVKSLQLKELKNGRLAMIAMAGFAAEHFIPGSVPLLTGKF